MNSGSVERTFNLMVEMAVAKVGERTFHVTVRVMEWAEGSVRVLDAETGEKLSGRCSEELRALCYEVGDGGEALAFLDERRVWMPVDEFVAAERRALGYEVRRVRAVAVSS